MQPTHDGSSGLETVLRPVATTLRESAQTIEAFLESRELYFRGIASHWLAPERGIGIAVLVVLAIAIREAVGLVGPTATGKSCLASALLSFLCGEDWDRVWCELALDTSMYEEIGPGGAIRPSKIACSRGALMEEYNRALPITQPVLKRVLSFETRNRQLVLAAMNPEEGYGVQKLERSLRGLIWTDAVYLASLDDIARKNSSTKKSAGDFRQQHPFEVEPGVPLLDRLASFRTTITQVPLSDEVVRLVDALSLSHCVLRGPRKKPEELLPECASCPVGKASACNQLGRVAATTQLLTNLARAYALHSWACGWSEEPLVTLRELRAVAPFVIAPERIAFADRSQWLRCLDAYLDGLLGAMHKFEAAYGDVLCRLRAEGLDPTPSETQSIDAFRAAYNPSAAEAMLSAARRARSESREAAA